MRAAVRGLLLVVAVALAPRPAWADDASEALITRGIELREKGKDDEALVLFRQALARSPSARARAQVALAEQALGLWVDAESDLVAALAEESDPWISKHRQALEGALAVIRRHVGSLEVRGNDGAEVYLDGVRLGALPSGAFRVAAGPRRLELRRAGFHNATRVVEVPAAGVARETLVLVPATEAPGAGAGSADTSAVDLGRGQRRLGWVLGAVGLGMAGVGTVAVVLRENEKISYNAEFEKGACPGTNRNQPPECEARLEKVRTFLTIGVTSYVAGGVFLVGGAVVLLTAPAAPTSRQAGATLRCAPGLAATEAQVVCGGVF